VALAASTFGWSAPVGDGDALVPGEPLGAGEALKRPVGLALRPGLLVRAEAVGAGVGRAVGSPRVPDGAVLSHATSARARSSGSARITMRTLAGGPAFLVALLLHRALGERLQVADELPALLL
jgi:hypothetical protein